MLKREFVIREYQSGGYEIISPTIGLKKIRYANGDTVFMSGSRVVHYITHDARVWTDDDYRDAIKEFEKLYVRHGKVY